MKIRTRCDEHGEVDVQAEEVVIDDEESVYRLVCPRTGHQLEKRMDDGIRTLLRNGGVRTIEEVVESEVISLADDEEIWKGVE